MPTCAKKKKNSTWDRKKLVSYPSGILVNRQLVGAKKPKNKKLSTYFGKLGFYFQREDVKVEISTETISLTGGSRTSVLSWSDTAHVLNQRQVLLHPDSDVTSTHDPINPTQMSVTQRTQNHHFKCEEVEVQKRLCSFLALLLAVESVCFGHGASQHYPSTQRTVRTQ